MAVTVQIPGRDSDVMKASLKELGSKEFLCYPWEGAALGTELSSALCSPVVSTLSGWLLAVLVAEGQSHVSGNTKLRTWSLQAVQVLTTLPGCLAPADTSPSFFQLVTSYHGQVIH